MALSRTVIGTGTTGNQTEGTTHDGTFDCGTVTAGDLLLCMVGGTKGMTSSTTPWTAPSKSSGTATIGTVTSIGSIGASSDFSSCVQAWWIPVTGTGTLVLAYGDAVTSFGCDIHAWKYTGHDTTTPVAGATTQEDPAASFSPTTATLGATPTADDEVIVFANGDTDAAAGKGWSAGSGFTERSETTSAANFCHSEAATRTASTSTTITWPTHDGTPTVYTVAGLAFIVKAAAVVAAATPRPLVVPSQAAQRASRW